MSTQFGFILGFCAALYAIVFMKQKKDSKKLKDGFKGISVFINFLIIDKDEAIQHGVEGRFTPQALDEHIYVIFKC
jgi:hypothetical protein